jgi:hypothetical protein
MQASHWSGASKIETDNSIDIFPILNNLAFQTVAKSI